jgi:hypothetical protein
LVRRVYSLLLLTGWRDNVGTAAERRGVAGATWEAGDVTVAVEGGERGSGIDRTAHGRRPRIREASIESLDALAELVVGERVRINHARPRYLQGFTPPPSTSTPKPPSAAVRCPPQVLDPLGRGRGLGSHRPFAVAFTRDQSRVLRCTGLLLSLVEATATTLSLSDCFSSRTQAKRGGAEALALLGEQARRWKFVGMRSSG